MKATKMVDLYSYWMTSHFLLYKAFEKYAPTWMSPYPALLIGFFVQLYIFYAGRKTLKRSFIVAVFIWKLSMLLLTRFNMDWQTIMANLALFGIYLASISIRGVSFKYLYTDAIYKTEQSHKSLADFVRFRMSNIF
jgi:hypothetical protein